MTVQGLAIHRWVRTIVNGQPTNSPDLPTNITGLSFTDIAGTPGQRIPPVPNIGLMRFQCDNVTDVPTLDAWPGVIVLAAKVLATDVANEQDVAGYDRDAAIPAGAKLTAIGARLRSAGLTLAAVNANVKAGMTWAQVADALGTFARNL